MPVRDYSGIRPVHDLRIADYGPYWYCTYCTVYEGSTVPSRAAVRAAATWNLCRPGRSATCFSITYSDLPPRLSEYPPHSSFGVGVDYWQFSVSLRSTVRTICTEWASAFLPFFLPSRSACRLADMRCTAYLCSRRLALRHKMSSALPSCRVSNVTHLARSLHRSIRQP